MISHLLSPIIFFILTDKPKNLKLVRLLFGIKCQNSVIEFFFYIFRKTSKRDTWKEGHPDFLVFCARLHSHRNKLLSHHLPPHLHSQQNGGREKAPRLFHHSKEKSSQRSQSVDSKYLQLEIESTDFLLEAS